MSSIINILFLKPVNGYKIRWAMRKRFFLNGYTEEVLFFVFEICFLLKFAVFCEF
jgi:hypothetical protein